MQHDFVTSKERLKIAYQRDYFEIALFTLIITAIILASIISITKEV